MTVVGGLVFGLVVGFITYRTLVRTTPNAAITDLAAVISAIGGGAVTSLYNPTSAAFAWYAIGLAVGMGTFFFAYWKLNGKAALAKVMNGDTTVLTRRPTSGGNSDDGPQA
ncbi:hypothetical protein [Amycolatopsis sp. NPDC021455]|uniref:hypothetical protein n=1 Tax=Amycolatopsis sp. NPDC021455 TaxID=3154901 RepID=UPI0033EC17FD